MSDTRVNLRTRTQRRMDAVGSPRWNTTGGATGELDQIGGLVHWREWRRLLNVNRNLRLGSRAITSSASTGRYALSALNQGAADTLETLYRILSFQVDNIPYQQVAFEDFSLAEALGLPGNVWWREGDNIMTLPKQFSKAATVWVNHLPARLDLLSGDGISVTFPDGYEDVLCLEWAALALSKGGAETEAARDLKGLAEEMRQDMLQDLGRLGTEPLQMRYWGDSAADWGGR